MTDLRKKLMAELKLRNRRETTIDSYVAQIYQLSKYYILSPETLSIEQIRHYGILSNSQRAALVAQSRALIERIHPNAKEFTATEEPEPKAEQANEGAQLKIPHCRWCGSANLIKLGTLPNGSSDEPAVIYQAIASG